MKTSMIVAAALATLMEPASPGLMRALASAAGARSHRVLW